MSTSMATPITTQFAVEAEALRKTYWVKADSREPQGIPQKVRHFFRPKQMAVDAVKDLSFSIRQGERVAFVGPNGAGKSTTIKMMAGILYPTEGSIRVLGQVPGKDR